jgi:hypothetical protein
MHTLASKDANGMIGHLLIFKKLFGCGITFYGGPGESAHKQFIKIPGQRTQLKVSEFAQQTTF